MLGVIGLVSRLYRLAPNCSSQGFVSILLRLELPLRGEFGVDERISITMLLETTCNYAYCFTPICRLLVFFFILLLRLELFRLLSEVMITGGDKSSRL